MARRTRIAVLSGATALVLLAAALVLVVTLLDWNRFKGIITTRASEATGRELAIAGDISVDWGWHPRVTLEGVTLENADWSSDPYMVEIRRLSVRIEILELLRGRIVLPEVELDRPRLILERNDRGDGNWAFEPAGVAEAASPDDRTEVPIVERLAIREGEIVYRDPGREIDVRSRISTVVGTAGEGSEQVNLSGTGTVGGEPLSVDIDSGPLVDLRDPHRPYPLKGTIAVGDTKASLEGTLLEPARFRGMDLVLHVQGANVGDLFPIIGVPAPETPPYDIRGRLTRDGEIWRFENFDGTVGDSDLAGTLDFDAGGERLTITGDLRSQRLDFDDLGGIVGAPTGTGEGETASEEQQRRAEIFARRDKLLPNAPIDFEKVRSVDARVTFTGEDVLAPNVPLEGVRLGVMLEDGVLRLDPLQIGVAGGRVSATIQLDARTDTVVSDMDVHLSGFRLEEVVEGAGGSGEIFGRTQLRTWGNSIADALATADGDFALMMNSGSFSNLVMELAGLDVAEALGFALGDDQQVPIRCAVLDFEVADGVMRSRTIVLDTTDTNIIGEAVINLGDEELAVDLEAQPKDPSLFSARTPVMVTGTFRDVSVGIDAESAGIRAGAAVALGVLLTPLAGVLAFVEPGPGEDSACASLIRGAEEDTNDPPGQ